MIKTIKGLSQAKKIIKEFKPDVIIRNRWIHLWSGNHRRA